MQSTNYHIYICIQTSNESSKATDFAEGKKTLWKFNPLIFYLQKVFKLQSTNYYTYVCVWTIKQSNKATNFAESKEMLQKFIPLIAGLAALAVAVVLAVVLTHQLCAPSVIFLWRSATGHLPARGKTVRVCVLCKTVCMCVSFVRRGMSYVRQCVCVCIV